MKTIITILFFLISFICSSQIVNYYDMKDGTGTTLTDHKGTADGTLAPAGSLPTWNTGYLSFVGGHNTTGGDYNRVNFTSTSFNYSWNASYSWLVIWRSIKDDAATHAIVKNRDINSAVLAYIYFNINPDESSSVGVYTASAQSKAAIPVVNTCDGKWHISIITYSTNSLVAYIDGQINPNTVDQNITSGNFYTATNKVTMGAAWAQTAGNYQQDFTGDVCRFINCNAKITGAKVQDIETDFVQLIY